MKKLRYILLSVIFGFLTTKGFSQTLPSFDLTIQTQNVTYYGHSTDAIFLDDGSLNPDYVAPAFDGLFEIASSIYETQQMIDDTLADNPDDLPPSPYCLGSAFSDNSVTGVTVNGGYFSGWITTYFYEDGTSKNVITLLVIDSGFPYVWCTLGDDWVLSDTQQWQPAGWWNNENPIGIVPQDAIDLLQVWAWGGRIMY